MHSVCLQAQAPIPSANADADGISEGLAIYVVTLLGIARLPCIIQYPIALAGHPATVPDCELHLDLDLNLDM